jgi:hypothetical protein
MVDVLLVVQHNYIYETINLYWEKNRQITSDKHNLMVASPPS